MDREKIGRGSGGDREEIGRGSGRDREALKLPRLNVMAMKNAKK